MPERYPQDVESKIWQIQAFVELSNKRLERPLTETEQLIFNGARINIFGPFFNYPEFNTPISLDLTPPPTQTIQERILVAV